MCGAWCLFLSFLEGQDWHLLLLLPLASPAWFLAQDACVGVAWSSLSKLTKFFKFGAVIVIFQCGYLPDTSPAPPEKSSLMSWACSTAHLVSPGAVLIMFSVGALHVVPQGPGDHEMSPFGEFEDLSFSTCVIWVLPFITCVLLSSIILVIILFFTHILLSFA